MSAPRIVFLTRSLDVGGSERQLAELAVGLHRSGWHVSVVSFYRGGVFEDRLREAGVPVICLDKGGRWDVLRFGWRLVRAIRRARPDIVHGNLGAPNVLLSLLRPAWPGVRVVWGVSASHAALRDDDWLVAVEARLGDLLARFADLIVCNSEAGRAHHLGRGYPADRTIVVPNGINTDEFRPDAAARSALRAEWGIADDEKLIGMVARLDPIKDHANFLRAAAIVLAAESRVRFVSIGGGAADYRDHLKALAQELGLQERMTWAGERDDMPRVYNALDVAVSSSASEGLPNAVAEAMATQLACAATAVGDTAALIGPAGWLCAPRDSAALARAMLDALSARGADPAQARQRICAHYSTAAMVAASLTHFSGLISKPVAETAS